MTHRSVGVFIILAALLVAVPQASRDLLNLAGDAGDQARSAVLRAFLGLNAGSAIAAPARKDAAALTASCQAVDEGRRSAHSTAQTEGRARLASKSEAAAVAAESPELAMILEHPGEVPHAPAGPDMGLVIEDFEFSQTPAPLLKNAVGQSELAMIIPPDASIPPVIVKSQRAKMQSALSITDEVSREVRAATLLTAKTALLRAEAADLRREVYVIRREATADAEAAKGGVRVKVRAPVSAPKKATETLACGAPQFIKVADLPTVVAPVAPAYYVGLSE